MISERILPQSGLKFTDAASRPLSSVAAVTAAVFRCYAAVFRTNFFNEMFGFQWLEPKTGNEFAENSGANPGRRPICCNSSDL
jgi:hypothetical protein